MTTHQPWKAFIPVQLTRVTTRDGVVLSGIVVEPSGRKDVALIWLHGLTSSFDSGQALINKLSQACWRQHIGYFKFDTRGHHLVDFGTDGKRNPYIGSTHEHFTDCVKDIQAVISLARRRGYRCIILAGHSTGAQKAVYYLAKTKDRRVQALLLAGPASDIAGELIHHQTATLLRRLRAARQRIKQRPNQLVPKSWGPWSYQRYVSLFTPGSTEDTFPYHRLGGSWSSLRQIRVPILMVSGEKDTYLLGRAKNMMTLFRAKASSTKKFTGVIVPKADHGFHSFEQQLTTVISTWLRQVV